MVLLNDNASLTNMTDNSEKPFSAEYVLDTTVRKMRKAVDISISKTIERIPEFADNQEKSREIFKVLAQLHQIRKSLVSSN